MPVSRGRKRKGTVKSSIRKAPRRGPWNASRAARDALASRESLKRWLTSENVRDQTPAEAMLIGRLVHWYPEDSRDLVAVAQTDFDLQVEPQGDIRETRSAIATAWTSAWSKRLHNAPIYILSPEMLPVVIAAANSLTLSDALEVELLREHDPRGFLVLPRDLIIKGNPLLVQDLEDLRAFAWSTSHCGVVIEETGEVLSRQPTTRFLSLSPTYGGLTSDIHERNMEMARRIGAHIPDLTWSGESWFPHHAMREATRAAQLEEMRKQAPAVIEMTGKHIPGDVVEDPEASFQQRFLAAFWRLCDQKIAVVSQQATEPAGKQARGSRVWPDVNVVTLRRHRPVEVEGREARAVDWQHRWVVQMHRRRQWYPSEGVHRIIFVGPYIKGPEGFPLKPTAEQVRALVR